MKKYIGVVLLLSGLAVSSLNCAPLEVSLALECEDAYYEADTFGELQSFDPPTTQTYFGLAGKPSNKTDRSFFLQYPIVLTLRFEHHTIKGSYTYLLDGEEVHITGQADTEGHLILHEEHIGDDYLAYRFQGRLTPQEVIGNWMLGYDREGFDFFATVDKHSPWLVPVTPKNRRPFRESIDRHGNTELHVLARHHLLNEIKLIIETEGGLINTQNSLGQTPLHRAVEWKREKLQAKDVSEMLAVVTILLQHGADANVRDNNGLTPLAIARENGLEEIVRILQDNGAKE